MQVDQVLFWDTTSDGVVKSSLNIQQLRRKIKATHLIGGNIIIRPAELFEGSESYYKEATEEKGLLYQLMKAGKAYLALPPGNTIYNRAERRFQDNYLVNNGRHITSKTEIDKIKYRTYHRADTLYNLQWPNSSYYKIIPESNDEIRSNKFRNIIKHISNKYFTSNIEETDIGKYLCGDEIVLKRGVLYKRIEGSWSSPLEPSLRPMFIKTCKDALTLISAGYNACEYGGRMSEVLPYTIDDILYGNSCINGISIYTEADIIDSFLRIASAIKINVDTVGYNNFASSLRTDDAADFVNGVSKCNDRHRQFIQELLYSPSKALGDDSLTEYCAFIKVDGRHDYQKELDCAVVKRMRELNNTALFDIEMEHVFIGALIGYTVSCIFLKLYPYEFQPLLNTIFNISSSQIGGVMAYKLSSFRKDENIVYGGYCCPVVNRR